MQYAHNITKIIPNDTTNVSAKEALATANKLLNNNIIIMALKNDHPAIYANGDYVVTSSQLEYDVTIGSSVGD